MGEGKVLSDVVGGEKSEGVSGPIHPLGLSFMGTGIGTLGLGLFLKRKSEHCHQFF